MKLDFLKKRKRLFIIAGSVLGVVGVTVGIIAGVAGAGGKTVYVYPYSIVGIGSYWQDSQQTYGPVRSDNIQTVTLTDTQEVTSVNVKVGDTVKKNDILMTFDSTLSELALEKKRLAVEQLKQQLQQEKDRLQEIMNYAPYTPIEKKYTWVDPVGQDAFQDEQKYIPLDTAAPETWSGPLGGENDPIILWARSGCGVNNDLFEKLAEFLGKARAARPSTDPDPSGSEDDDIELYQDTTPEDVREYYMVLKQVEGDNTVSKATAFYGMHVFNNSGNWTFLTFDASNVYDYTRTGTPGYTIVSGGDEDHTGSMYTLEEIVKMKEDQQKTILDVEYKIKVAEAEYSIAQRETKDGNVRSEVDGKVISVLTPEEAKEKKQPIIKVSGGGGFYVVGSISELSRDKLVIGSEVTVFDNQTGNMYTGTVESIGDYPSADSGYNDGNSNASSYPFTVFVDESADLVGGNYVRIEYELTGDSTGLCLQNAFVRKENGQNVVYVQGANGKLERRTVRVGKSVWGSYKEILSGITESDLVAFPYGKNVKEGAPTEQGDYTNLYGA